MAATEPNKLIIIGNGFDLAHGLETGYVHFMFWAINNEIENLYNGDKGTVILEMKLNISIDKIDVFKKKSLSEYHDFFFHKPYEISNLPENITFEEYRNINITDSEKKSIKIKNNFFEHLLKKQNLQNWVDIENEYYAFLIKFFKNEIIEYKNYTVENLNSDFEEIKHLLVLYLKTINSNVGNENINQILLKIAKPYFNIDEKLRKEQIIKPICILNFNYTKTPNSYNIFLSENYLSELIYIHGDLYNIEKNPIIFGYGDDTDAKYNEIEQCGHNEYLKYIKDFEYLKTQNYSKMESFVEAEDFEVYIMGHSCGKSDRTLLKYIFQHKNCKKIYIKYKDEQDYFDKTKEIARAFDNKAEFRNKVASLKNTPNVGPLVG